MRILLLGGQGQLATSLSAVLAEDDVVALSHQELDICDAQRVAGMVKAVRPDVIINTAAVRRPDACELAPEHAFAVNALGARNVALACVEAKCALAHISTDYVFDGMRRTPYFEEDPPNPVNVYGTSKLAGEIFVKQIVERHYVIRTSPLFGGATDPARASNFVLALLRRADDGLDTNVVTDQWMTPTYTLDVARKISWLIRRDTHGVYHISNGGHCTWYEFAQAVAEKALLRTRLIPITTNELVTPARRIRYSVLGHGMLERLESNDLPHWENALERYLQVLGRHRAPVIRTTEARRKEP